jgi:hypothetical protein
MASAPEMAGPFRLERTYGQGGRRRERLLAKEAPPERSGAEAIESPPGSIVVRGRLAGCSADHIDLLEAI